MIVDKYDVLCIILYCKQFFNFKKVSFFYTNLFLAFRVDGSIGKYILYWISSKGGARSIFQSKWYFSLKTEIDNWLWNVIESKWYWTSSKFLMDGLRSSGTIDISSDLSKLVPRERFGVYEREKEEIGYEIASVSRNIFCESLL